MKIGDKMLAIYKNSRKWLPCTVSGVHGTGQWIIQWEDGDTEDTLKPSRKLKAMAHREVADNEGSAEEQWGPRSQEELAGASAPARRSTAAVRGIVSSFLSSFLSTTHARLACSRLLSL